MSKHAHALVGSRTGETFQLGDEVSVRLVEAIATAGALRFEILSGGKKGRLTAMKGSARPPPEAVLTAYPCGLSPLDGESDRTSYPP